MCGAFSLSLTIRMRLSPKELSNRADVELFVRLIENPTDVRDFISS